MATREIMARILEEYKEDQNRLVPINDALVPYTSVEKFKTETALTSVEDIQIGFALQARFFQLEDGRLTFWEDGPAIVDVIAREVDDPTHADCGKARTAMGGTAVGSLGNLVTALRNAKTWMVELIMCQQVKPLKRENIKNYFKSCGTTVSSLDYLFKFLKVAAAQSEKLINNDEVRNICRTNKFVANHTNYASSGALVNRAIQELGQFAGVLFTNREIEAAAQAAGAPWDMKFAEDVSEQSRAITYVYYDANSSLPDNWYQGEAAVQLIPTAQRKAYRSLFKAISRITADPNGYEEAENAFQVFRAIPAPLRRGPNVIAAPPVEDA